MENPLNKILSESKQKILSELESQRIIGRSPSGAIVVLIRELLPEDLFEEWLMSGTIEDTDG